MSAVPIPLVSRARGSVAVVLTAAAVVWLLDGLYATTLCLAMNPTCTVMRTWQGVAAALVGREAALGGGVATFALGLAVHFTVALAWTTLFWLAATRWEALARFTDAPARAVAVGMAYGVVVWCAMSLVIVPMTRGRATPFGTRAWWILLAAHLTVVGPPIVLLAHPRRAAR
jgi:hypothetical protein